MELNELNEFKSTVSEEDAVSALIDWSESLEVTPTVSLINVISTYLRDQRITENDIRTTVEHLIVMAIPKSRGVHLYKMFMIKDQLMESCQNKLQRFE